MAIQILPPAGASRPKDTAAVAPRRAMRRELFWLAAGVILVSGVLLASVLAYLRAQALEAGERLTGSFAQVIEEQTSRTLQTVDQQLRLAMGSLAQRQAEGPLGEAEARTLLREQIKELPFLRAIWVLDAQGRILFDTEVGNIGLDLSDRAYFLLHRDEPQPGFHIGSPLRNRTKGTWMISASRPLVAPDGRFTGIIGAALGLPYFEKLWGNIDLGADGSVALLRRSGELLMRSPINEAFLGHDFSDLPVFRESQAHPDAGSFHISSPIDQVERQYAYRALSLRPDLVVMVGQSRALMLGPWRQLAALALGLWTLASLALMWFCSALDKAWRQSREADAERHQAAQRLALATEVASIGVWDWDMQTDQWYASPTYASMLGYEPLEGGRGDRTQWLDRVHPDDRSVIAAKIEALKASPDLPYQYEARIRHADGSYRWIYVIGRVLSRDAHGNVARLLGVRIDINARKQAEEERLGAFERITDAFVALDRNYGVTHVNQLAAQLMHCEPAQLIGKHLWTEVPAMADPALQQAMDQALATQTPVTEELYLAPLACWFESRIYPSADGLTVYFHDVSERRRNAQALRDSEARYRELFEGNPHPMWVYDIETMIFLAVNDAAVAHYGYSRAEFLAMSIWDIRLAEDIPALMADLAISRAGERDTQIKSKTGYRDPLVWRHRRKNGETFLVEVTVHAMVFDGRQARLIHAHDVTARREAEEKLRLSEESLSITLQSIGDAVIATDIAGRITRMNVTAERLTGWPLADAAGRPLDEVFHIINAQTRVPVENPVQLVLARGEVVGLANHTALLARNGAEYQISDSGAPIRDAGGHMVGVVLVFSDVTEAYRVREALATTVELLERTGEMAKVGGWELDLRTGRCFFSRETCHIHDVEPDTSPTMEEALAFYPLEARQAVHELVQAGIEHGAPWDVELPLITARGRRIWVRSQGFAAWEDGKVVRLRGALHDITERKQAEDNLRAASLRTQTILDNMTDGVITIDAQGRVESFNRAASRMFGYETEEVLGHDVTMLMPVHYRDRHGSFLVPHRSAQPPAIVNTPRELEGARKDGSVFPMSLSVSRNLQSGRASFIGVVRDITQQREDMEEIRRLAFFDLLTGLPNRRLLMDRLRQAMTASARTDQHGALMLLDLDHFKLLNDSAGHDVGDILLQQVAVRLQTCVRECDSVARLGGDEFVVLLEALSTVDHEAATQAEIIANKILDAFQASFTLRGQVHDSTTSIGIVVFKGDQVGMDDLIKKADVAMYQAKSAGRNNARFFDPAMQAAVAAHEALERDLRRGLGMQEFVLHYQIQVDGQGRTTGAEALVRWNHPVRGLVAPGHFIPLAEETGLILPLGQWVLETACAQLVAWAVDPATAQWTMAVNVSASQFAQANFVEHVAQALRKAGADAGLLKLELTESMLVGDMEDVVRKMNQIKSQGVGFSLDDFGTGYSSLSYLKRLPLDQLKIDQSFVRDVLSDASDAVIARTIVALGQSLGLKVIAEGVETAAHRDFLAEIGCDGFQGYFFGRPKPAQALVASLSS